MTKYRPEETASETEGGMLTSPSVKRQDLGYTLKYAGDAMLVVMLRG